MLCQLSYQAIWELVILCISAMVIHIFILSSAVQIYVFHIFHFHCLHCCCRWLYVISFELSFSKERSNPHSPHVTRECATENAATPQESQLLLKQGICLITYRPPNPTSLSQFLTSLFVHDLMEVWGAASTRSTAATVNDTKKATIVHQQKGLEDFLTKRFFQL